MDYTLEEEKMQTPPPLSPPPPHPDRILVDLLHQNISIHILHTVIFIFPTVMARRICFTIRSFLHWRSFLLMTFIFDSRMLLWGEIRSQSLWGVKGFTYHTQLLLYCQLSVQSHYWLGQTLYRCLLCCIRSAPRSPKSIKEACFCRSGQMSTCNVLSQNLDLMFAVEPRQWSAEWRWTTPQRQLPLREAVRYRLL